MSEQGKDASDNAEQNTEKRKVNRMPTRVKIRVRHERIGDLLTYTRDISEDGIFILAKNLPLEVGDVVSGQVQDLPMEAPEVEMRVVRIEQTGMGLLYLCNQQK